MCGIAAILSSTNPVTREALEAATLALAHRGPDGQGTWMSRDHRVGLGHRRLNIVSAEGVQPIPNETGQLQIVANGEFYDFIGQREALERRGHRFSTETDSEIAVHLYEEMGIECLSRLRGEFAFILWDGRTGTLIAARDRFGIKPLFWGQDGDRLLLASEAKALFAAGMRPVWDEQAVYDQLFGCFAPGSTLFRGVHQVPPGHYLVARKGMVRLVRYWDLDYPRASALSSASEEECVSRSHDLLEDAVHLRTRAHVPVGYLVSGGLDSSSLLGIGARTSANPVQGFTIAFEGPQHDESEKAREAARYAGADLHVLRVTDDALADAMPESAWYGEALQFNAHGTARFLLSREIQALGYRAVMAGEGADELFAGYGFLRYVSAGSPGAMPSLANAARLIRLFGRLDASGQSLATVSPLVARLIRGASIPEQRLDRLVGTVTLMSSLLHPHMHDRFRRHDPYWSLLRGMDWRQIVGRERARQALYLWFRTVFAGYHMAADRLDMAHAVEVRLPFLDHVLFEGVRDIPVAVLARDGRQKSLLREAVRPYVPASIYSGAKQPFYAPPSASQPGTRLHDLVQDTLRSETINAIPFFDGKSLRVLMDQVARQEAPDVFLDPILIATTTLCLLHEAFGIQAPA